MKPRNSIRTVLAISTITFALAQATFAGEPTAFELIKEGNRYVGEQSKDKVVQIRSEKSVGTLTPNIWYVVYYDSDATFKSTEVKFGAGKKMTVKRPARVIEMGTGDDKTLDRAKFKVDSDKAIKIALAEPLLKSLTIKATRLILQRGDQGPVWKVTLWAAKLKNPNADADIGSVYVASDTGEVARLDLHINRVD
ncbi:MAG: hypothetical protein EPO07_04360 [Verrucomicrobia bacterium]|nr:MAG: hypothetical protein EPO07_04360 [Verrucomicrobiota bacterium]